jgi:DNA-binding beta-propeller fold protein YncE
LLNSPHSIFANSTFVAAHPNGHLAVSDADTKKVWIVSTDYENAYSLDSGFCRPHGVAFDREGNLLVADRNLNKIRVFANDGKFIRDFGQEGSALGSMHGPLGIAVAPDGTIFVTEAEGGRVQAFDPAGTARWIYPHFECPTAIAFNATQNTLWVADWTKNTVTGFELDATEHLLPRHTLEGFTNPHGLAVDTRGLLHVTDANGYYVYERVADADTSVLYLRILENAQLAGPPNPSGIAEAKDGNIIVCHGPSVLTLPPIQFAEREDADFKTPPI